MDTSPEFIDVAENNVMSALPERRPSVDNAVTVYLVGDGTVNPAGFVWNANDAFRLRKHFRILGDFVGTLPKHTAQNQFLSLPLALSSDELHFAFLRGFLRIVRDTSQQYKASAQPADAAAHFYSLRAHALEVHAREAVKQQEIARLRYIAKNGAQPRDNGAESSKRRSSKKRPRSKMLETDSARLNVGAFDDQPLAKIPRGQDGILRRIARSAMTVLSFFFPSIAPVQQWEPKVPAGQEATTRPTSTYLAPTSPAAVAPNHGFARPWRTGPPAVSELRRQEVSLRGENASDRSVSPDRDEEFEMIPPLADTRRLAQARAAAVVSTETEAREDERVDASSFDWVDALPLPRGVTEEKMGARLAVFADLYDRGYCMSCGAKFGVDFLAYAGDPLLFHGSLAVVVMDRFEDVSPHDVVALGRLGDSTKKRTVAGYVIRDEQQRTERVVYVGVQWEETLP